MTDIRYATHEEAMDILNHPTVVKLLNIVPESINDGVESYILGEKALLLVKPCDDIAEVHIACKRKDRAGLRSYLERVLVWLNRRGFKEVFTTAPDNRTGLINMLESLGFKKKGGRFVWE